MVNFRMISETEFRTGNSDYAKSLRSIYGDDGYQKYSAKINSIIAEAGDDNKKTAPENPLKRTNEQRIAYLEAEYARVKMQNAKNKSALQRFIAKLSGMLKISSLDEENLALKQRAQFNSNIDEDTVLSALHDAYLARGMRGYDA